MSETQFVIAREAGYASWSEMIQATEPVGMDTDGLVRILAHACLTSDEFTISEVLSVRPTLTDESLVSALCLASPEVRNLVDDQKINEPLGPWPLVIDVDGTLPGEALLGASMLGEEQLVMAFLDSGVDVNFKSVTNTTALHQAALGGYRSLVELLLDRGADPAIRDSTYDGTAVGWAYAGGHESLAEMLVEVIKNRDTGASE